MNQGLLRSLMMTPTVSVSYGGKLEELRKLHGYTELMDTCRKHGVDFFESMMSLTAMVNVGRGSLSLGFASEAPAYD